VRLADPPIELKVYAEDVARSLGGSVRLTRDETALARTDPGEQGVRVTLGDAVLVRCEGFDPKRDRWRFSLRRA